MFTVTVLPTIDREFVQTGKVRWCSSICADEYPSKRSGGQVAMCARAGGSGEHAWLYSTRTMGQARGASQRGW